MTLEHQTHHSTKVTTCAFLIIYPEREDCREYDETCDPSHQAFLTSSDEKDPIDVRHDPNPSSEVSKHPNLYLRIGVELFSSDMRDGYN